MNFRELLNIDWEISKEVQIEEVNYECISTEILTSLDLETGANENQVAFFGYDTETRASLIVESHSKWIRSEAGGMQAMLLEDNFRGVSFRGSELDQAEFIECNLRKTDFWGASLQEANFIGADLRAAEFGDANLNAAQLQNANLRLANLKGAQFYSADLSFADLRGADLRGTDLRGADLRGADLRDADLRNARLEDANLCEATLSPYNITPVQGSFIGWMAVGEYVLQIAVPVNAQRINPIGSRSCRAEQAVTVKTFDKQGAPVMFMSLEDIPAACFVEGAILNANDFNADPRIDRTGIIFYMTFEEAAQAAE